jgi:DNA polymerase-3 subunit gamma/tau
MLTSNAFNAFLKTLEEPPAHAIFILATTEKHKILPTILSRCQIFDFKRITPADIAGHLEEIATKENIKAEPTALHVIAQKSDGCMRDALSILDKIVSFTSANLTYSNTLEHLNLLDEDYFFKLLDLLDSEDLPGVLTIYDEIDKKGFDGDMVLNNLSEFFRNLLVSRDPRSISLLQVVEGFRNRYIAAAASISPAYMIGALNILNDAELGFKQARNKKLHVEFHLIKLTHLKQAVNLVEDGNAIKKKRVDEIRPVAFKQITFAPQKTKPSAKLVIETPLQTVQPKQMQPTASVFPSATEKPLAKPTPIATPSQAPAEPVSGGFGSLKKIREQIQNRKNEQAEVFTLNEERLGTAWTAYLQKLQENNQVTSLSNLKMAKVTIIDELVFEIMADTRIQQQFIESEKVGLLIHVQDFFNNPKVQFLVQLNPSADVEEVIKDQPLSLREQYFKMIERYPIIKDMRDQLNLDLDY